MISGTLIATFVTAEEIFLFSDGRVKDYRKQEIFDNWSKIHKLTDKVGMLVAGRYLPSLAEDIREICTQDELIFVEDVVQVVQSVLENLYIQIQNDSDKEYLQDLKIFVFVTGFSKNDLPKLFYFDNTTNPPFCTNEKKLKNEVEIGAMSTGSGTDDNPSAIMVEYLKMKILQKKILDFNMLFFASFNKAKGELEKTNELIGGKTYFSKVSKKHGFHNIYD